jgi:hypothetical protein
MTSSTKECAKCKVEKPTTAFSNLASAKDGLQRQCKECKNAYAKVWAKTNPEVKRQRDKKYREQNPEWVASYYSKYYENNRNKQLEYSKKFQQENKEHLKEYRKAYYEANKDKILTYQAEYRQENKHKHAISEAKRRAVKLNATPAWLTEDDLDVIGWVYEMREERTKATGVVYHVDHIVPLQGKDVCGLHVWWNMQLLPASENISKSNKLEVTYGVCA